MKQVKSKSEFNRRKFLLASAAGLFLPSCSSSVVRGLSDSSQNMRTIDVHAHFLPPVYLDALEQAGMSLLDGGIPTPSWSPERALAIMDEVGVTGAVLSVSSPHLNFVEQSEAIRLARAINDYSAEATRLHPDRFGAFAILPLPDMSASLAEMERAIDDLNLDGVALPTHVNGDYLGSESFAPLLEALNDRGVTVFVHPTSPACFESFGLGVPAPMIEFPFDTTRTVTSLIYSGALARYRRINFILPHGGGTLPYLARRISGIGAASYLGDRSVPAGETMQMLSELYYDTASATTSAQMNALLELAPVSQLLYGTDFPFAPEARMRGADDAFKALGFTREEEEMIRHQNAAPLFPAFHARCCG